VFEEPTVSILKTEIKRTGGRGGIWRKETWSSGKNFRHFLSNSSLYDGETSMNYTITQYSNPFQYIIFSASLSIHVKACEEQSVLRTSQNFLSY
jgi:hypothetical protein